VLHRVIISENLADDACQFFSAANFDKLLEQFKSETLILPMVIDDYGEFTFVRAVQFAQASDMRWPESQGAGS
jgi:hypothetical protein